MKKPIEPDQPKYKIIIHDNERVDNSHSVEDIQNAFNILKDRIKNNHSIDIQFSDVIVEVDDIESGYDWDNEYQEYCRDGLMTVEFTKELPNKNYEKDLEKYIILNEKYKKDLVEYRKYLHQRIVDSNRIIAEERQHVIEKNKEKNRKREEKLRAKYGNDWKEIVENIAASNIKNKNKK